MKQEKTNGAKFALYNAGADYARYLSERNEKQAPQNAQLAGGYYVVAVGERLPPEPFPVYVTTDGSETTDEQQARAFDTYGDAVKWAADNCEFSQIDGVTIPRGFERPRYPRVCYLRIYTELTEC